MYASKLFQRSLLKRHIVAKVSSLPTLQCRWKVSKVRWRQASYITATGEPALCAESNLMKQGLSLTIAWEGLLDMCRQCLYSS